MHTARYSLWLGGVAFDCAVYMWYITVPVVGFMLIATVLSFRSGASGWIQSIYKLAILYLFPLFSLIIGSVFRAHGELWPELLLWIPTLSLVAAATIWVIRLKGFRCMVLSHSLLALWIEICVGFVASMAISDKWL